MAEGRDTKRNKRQEEALGISGGGKEKEGLMDDDDLGKE